MILNLLLLFSLSSLYLNFELFKSRKVPSLCSLIILITALLWVFLNIYDNFDQHITLFLFSNISVVFYFLHFYSIKEKSLRVAITTSFPVIVSFLFFKFQFVYYFVTGQFLLSMAQNVFILFLFQFFILYCINNFTSFLIFPRLVFNFNSSRFYSYLMIGTLLTFYFFKDYYEYLKYFYFFILYIAFHLPFYLKRFLLTLRHYLRSFIFSSLFLALALSYIILLKYTDFILLNSPFKLVFFLLSTIIFPTFFYLFNKITVFFDKNSFFSTLNTSLGSV